MMNGTGSCWTWHNQECGRWAAWRGTNSGFDQSINSRTDRDIPFPIKTPVYALVSRHAGVGAGTVASFAYAGEEFVGAAAADANIKRLLLLGAGA